MEVEFNFNGKTLTIQCNEYDIIGQIFQKFAIKIGANINSLTFLYNGDGNINRNLQINQVINYFDKNRNKMSVIVYDMNKSMISTYSNTSNNNTQFVYPNINYQNVNNVNNNLRMQETIKKQQEMIKMDEAQIKTLKNQLNVNTNNNNININDCSYNNFDIKFKEPQCQLNYHKDAINCATLLKDGRFATGSLDKSIIIYNNKTFQPDITINIHNDGVSSIIQLSSGILASSSWDNTIKLFNINNNNYNVLQTLNYHQNYVYKVIELNNKKLVSCSDDKSIIFYFKNNNEYVLDYKISTNGLCWNIIQTKEDEICYLEYLQSNDTKIICFFNLLERKLISKINNINYGGLNNLTMMSKDLLVIGGKNELTIINVNNHNIIRKINVPNSGYISAICLLNENILLTGDENKRIIQWKINGDNLILTSKKELCHENWIYILIKIGNGLILSGDSNGVIKIW